MNCWSATCLLRPRTPGCSGVAGELLVVPRRLTHTKDTNCSFAAKNKSQFNAKPTYVLPSIPPTPARKNICHADEKYHMPSNPELYFISQIEHKSGWLQQTGIYLASIGKKNKCQISKLPPPQAGSGLFTSSSSTSRTPSSWFPQMIQFSWTLCGRPRWSIQDILEMQQNQE